MRFLSFLKEIKKKRGMVEKRKKRKAAELSNPVRKKIRPSNQSQPREPSFLSPLPILPSFLSSYHQILLSSLAPSPITPSSLSPLPIPPSSLASSSASSSHNWIHDVFPSFRGEDVRREFLSHIQKEFHRKGITLFIDNKIERGESIGPELIRAIRGSKIAIILISKNYASSKWCLDELVEIMKCREELGQTVMTIFYKVDPSDVKKLAGDFGEVFRNTCKDRTKDETSRWRQALETVATIAGYDSSNWDNEAAMIENIAINVSNKLINSASSSDFDGLVGMGAHMEKMELILHLESDEVRMIGLWGPSGIGKSTIARVLFGRYSGEFQLSVFMENIKRRYPKPYYDEYSAKLQLQKDFLCQIFNHDDIRIHHLGVAQDRLKDKKVLVVLDDIDHLAQLNAIAKDTRWFGPGSRIIITTQDKRILNAHGINHIYEVGFPLDDEARKIFCTYAFGQNIPHDGFEELSWEVTKLAGRLPLGLRVMGCYFKGRSKNEWIKALPRLRNSLDGEIESILKFSYDALNSEDKDLFLYIACFFNNEGTEKVEEHLAKNFVDVRQGLYVLAEKSLISFSWGGYIMMHDLLARLGKEIVRKQSVHEPGQCQFLFDTTGSSIVRCIDFNHSENEDELHVTEEAFERMFNLQFLRACRGDNIVIYATHPKVINLPRKVTLLHWEYFPLTSLPCYFNPEFLVELNMPFNRLEKLWEGNQKINNLKWVDLSSSENLKEVPDLSTATNLEKLNLKGCSSLRELPSSIGNATDLCKLNLDNCSKLVELPSSIGNLTSLEALRLEGCSSLVELPSSIGNLINLKALNLEGCLSLVELLSSIGNLINIEGLDLKGCSSLVGLPYSIGNLINIKDFDLHGCSNLVKLPSSIGNLINLEYINLERCSNLLELPSSIGDLIELTELNLDNCSKLMELPSSIGNLTNLEALVLEGCSSLMKLPSSIGNIINLHTLRLEGCSSLVELPSSIGNLINIKDLDLHGCSNLAKLPSSIGNAINLEALTLGFSSLVELPSSIGYLISLTCLYLWGCSNLVKLPSSIGNLTNLEVLNLFSCSSLVTLPSSIGNLQKLSILNLYDCSKLESIPIDINLETLHELDLGGCSSLKIFPEISTNISILSLNGTAIEEVPLSIRSWSHLHHLHMSYSKNLEKFPHAFDYITKLHVSDTRIREIAPWVKELSRLESLVVTGCTELVSLPQLPKSLTRIDAENCKSLERLDCSFRNMKSIGLYFVNCFKLNQEARDLIIKTSTCSKAILPGEKVPSYFTYRVHGKSLSMKLNRFDTHLPTSLKFKACVLLIIKGAVEVEERGIRGISYRITEKQNGVNVPCRSKDIYHYLQGPLVMKHLYIFEFDEEVSSSELVFEFEFTFPSGSWEIGECGIRISVV